MDFFRRVFGLPHDDNFNRFSRNNETRTDNFFDESEPHRDGFPRRGFDMFSDPIQMQQYFEHELNEMLKIFGFQGFADHPFDHSSVPKLEDPRVKVDESPSSSLRNQFLKNGLEKPPERDSDKVDGDLDAKVKSGNLDSILGEQFDQEISPYERPKSSSFFYGTSHTMKTVTNPDGSVETHRTTRDNQGNEETTVCRKIGEKEYCLVTKKDKTGKEEVTERFMNMNENEKDVFLKSIGPRIGNGAESGFPFDKFFK